MQLLALLSNVPPGRNNTRGGRPWPLAARLGAAITVIAFIVAGLEYASRDRFQPSRSIATLEQEF
jgi:hypothetical protein